MANIIDGSKLSKQLKKEVAKKSKQLARKPGLAVVMVGNDAASRFYVNAKEKACAKAGFYSRKIELSFGVMQSELENTIQKLNQDAEIDAILIQLPLPERLDQDKIISLIHPAKDVDCLHPQNLGSLMVHKEAPPLSELLAPCTPKGVMRLIQSTGEKIDGKKAVVVGRSRLVGKPLALLLLAHQATVAICHSHTLNLIQECLTADILVSATGRPHLITGDLVKPGAIVIDVGINRSQNGLVGDVDFESVQEIAGHITPVPGGVGPMTIACLLENTLLLAQYAQS